MSNIILAENFDKQALLKDYDYLYLVFNRGFL